MLKGAGIELSEQVLLHLESSAWLEFGDHVARTVNQCKGQAALDTERAMFLAIDTQFLVGRVLESHFSGPRHVLDCQGCAVCDENKIIRPMLDHGALALFDHLGQYRAVRWRAIIRLLSLEDSAERALGPGAVRINVERLLQAWVGIDKVVLVRLLGVQRYAKRVRVVRAVRTDLVRVETLRGCLLYTSPSPRDRG